MDVFTSVLADHQAAFNTLESLKPAVTLAGESCIKTLKNSGKILICGNGGSAADAQHFSGEIVGRFIKERRGYPAIALTTDSSVLTSVGNDYSYDTIFSRQVGAFAKPGDILFGISTSGNSSNIANAMTEAKKHGITTIGLLGRDGGSIKDLCDIPIVVPFPKTPRVQECHIIIIHLICAMIDEELA